MRKGATRTRAHHHRPDRVMALPHRKKACGHTHSGQHTVQQAARGAIMAIGWGVYARYTRARRAQLRAEFQTRRKVSLGS